jgi:glucokinase
MAASGDAATIGVDIGGTKVLAVRLDAGGRVLGEDRRPTPRDGSELIDVVCELVTALRSPEARPLRVGVGAPGLVDRDGVLRFAPNLRHAEDLPIRATLEARLPGAHFRVGNDATCAGWAEHTYGAARGCDHALLITLGTGIGGGIVVCGQLLEGANGYAGEIGHMVVDPSGPPCPCGKRGCWERFASGSGLGRLARDAAHAGQAVRMVELAGGDPEAVRGEHVTRAAAEGDAQALEVMARFAWWLALGLANLANIFDPQCLVLGGGLVEAGPILLEPARRAFHDLVEGAEQRPGISIVLAELGERAGAIGAATLARD